MAQKSRRVGLRWKIGEIYTEVMLILAILAIAVIYQVTKNTLREQFDKHALAIATNLADAAAGHLVGKNLLALHSLASKYTLHDGVAYTFIQDSRGEILAQTLGSFPAALRQNLPRAEPRQVLRREHSLNGRTVREISLPVLDGQLGNVYVGFWDDVIESEIQNALFRIIGIILLIPLVGALLSFLVAQWIVRPIVELTQVADKITMGDLDASVSNECLESYDEIGELARSLERMRASLKAAMWRLNRETAPDTAIVAVGPKQSANS
jgi:methyl-accepting chemotaxis protein